MTRGTGDTATDARSSSASDEVLDAAERVLADGGFDQLSVRSIAARLDVSRQVVYTHFGGMGGLLDGLHRRLSHRLLAAVDSVGRHRDDDGSTDHVLAATAAYRSVARRWPELYQLAFEQPVPDHVVGLDAEADGRRAFARIIRLSGAWLDRHGHGSVPADDVELARALWSATHGFVVIERVGFASVSETDSLSDRAVLAMLEGWRTPPGSLDSSSPIP